MKNIIFLLFVLFISPCFLFSQQLNLKSLSADNNSNSKPELQQPPVKSYLGIGGGVIVEDNTGLALGFFAELKTEKFSFLPQANYWKVNDKTNFEIATHMRYRLKSQSFEPYFDGGIGVNFFNNTDPKNKESLTRLSLDIGCGIEFLNIGTTYSLFIDGKYKIIIKDNGNIKGIFVTGGINFFL